MKRLAGVVLVGCLAAGAAAMTANGASAAESLATALRLGADGPELRAMADGWRVRRGELLAHLASTAADERRGAARLCAVVGVGPGMTADALLAALVASADDEVRRLGAYGLLDHLDGIAPAQLLPLADARLVCQLLANHPAADPLADAAVRKQVLAWLGDPDSCEVAAVLVATRGPTAAWGPLLVEVIDSAAKSAASPASERLVATAHQALCLLTRTQRGLAPYLRHYDLLAKDWRDALAEKPALAEGPPDAATLALIAALPDAKAVRGLLELGAPALSALDVTMKGADRARRRQLQAAARLVARAVTPALYDELGEAGFEGMDAERSADRLQSLARAAEAVLRLHDAHGLVHLIAYLDDRDTVVRGAALDRLVRLADERKRFGNHWTMDEQGCFPPAQCLWRLRRALKQGGRDEQVAALQFTASLQARELSDDVVALMLSPTPMVVETALETLAHLSLKGQLPMLARLAGDRTQPALRRAKVLELIGKAVREDGSGLSAEVQHTVQQLITEESDPLVLGAAHRLQFQIAGTPEQQRASLTTMLGKDKGQRADALRLIRDNPVASANGSGRFGGERKPVLFVDLALPYLFDDDRDTAVLAATALAHALDDDSHRAAVAELFTASQRAALARWCGERAGDWPEHLAVALRLEAVPHALAMAKLRTLGGEAGTMPWEALIASANDTASLLDEVVAFQQGGTVISDHPLHELIALVAGEGLLAPGLLDETLAAGAIDALDLAKGASNSTNFGSDSDGPTATRTIALHGGATMHLKGTARKGAGNQYEDAAFVWTLVPPAPAHLPDAAGVQRLVAGLTALRAAGEVAAYRDLVVEVLTRSAPSAAPADSIVHYASLWRILAKRDPALRALLVHGLETAANSWNLHEFIENGNPDLLPAVVRILADPESPEWSIDRFVPYLGSLDAALLAQQLPTLFANPHAASDKPLLEMLGGLGKLPLTVALELIKQGQPPPSGIAAFGDDQLPALIAACAALKPEAVLAAAPALRRIREAAPAVFDRALVAQLERRDVASAAWLRTNLPYQAGLKSYYAEALASPVPELWMVGAAIGLKDGTLGAHDFLAKAAALPPPALGDAALVATRYLTGKLAGEGAALARIVAASPERALAAWLAIVPPDAALMPVLVARAARPAEGDLIAMALAPRLRWDHAGWLPLAQAVVKAAGGKLDYLLPAAER